MTKQIRVTEYMGPSNVYELEGFITAQTIDGFDQPLTSEEGQMLQTEIDQLRSLKVGELMPIGEPEAGLTVERLSDISKNKNLAMLQYWMTYPEERWVTSQELIDGANDAIINHDLDNVGKMVTNAEEAMDILEDLGDIGMTGETRYV